MNKKTVLCIFTLFFSFTVQARESNDSTKLFLPQITYTGDVAANLSGGMKTGTDYLGMVNLKLSMNIWKGGNLFINAANTHGAEPSAERFGDNQVASNIEAGDHTYLHELWFRQSWEKLTVTAGIQDLNIDVANTVYSAFYLNSSFGILPTVSGNIPAPIFPLTSLGICTNIKVTQKSSLHLSAFDGEPTDFSENPHNLKWHLSRQDGFLFFSEYQHETNVGKMPGTIKAGLYLHQHFRKGSEADGSDTLYHNNNGIYLLGEQQIWQSDHKNLGVFFQLGYSPKKMNVNKYYIGAGINYTGLISRKGEDVIGLAVAHNGNREFPGKETVIELTYKFPLFSFLFLQPDIQYIINPSGTGQKLENCFASILRFGFSLPVR